MKRNARITLGLVKSSYTGKVFIALFENSKPKKFWPYNEVNDAGIDIISSLIKGFDSGYDVEFQFPQDVNGERIIVPTEMVIVGEPGGKPENILNKKSSIQENQFYKKENNSDKEKNILPDEKMLKFLEDYATAQGL